MFNSLLFGLASAPSLFTRVIAPIVKQLALLGVRVASYIDDYFLTASPAKIVDHVERVESLFFRVGFSISDKIRPLSFPFSCVSGESDLSSFYVLSSSFLGTAGDIFEGRDPSLGQFNFTL